MRPYHYCLHRHLAPKYARVALISGGVAPVLDGGGGGDHSVFASAFLEALGANAGILERTRLSQMVSEAVVASPATAENEQLPQYGQIQNTRHEGGDFFLFPKSEP